MLPVRVRPDFPRPGGRALPGPCLPAGHACNSTGGVPSKREICCRRAVRSLEPAEMAGGTCRCRDRGGAGAEFSCFRPCLPRGCIQWAWHRHSRWRAVPQRRHGHHRCHSQLRVYLAHPGLVPRGGGDAGVSAPVPGKVQRGCPEHFGLHERGR